jgi:hypothetical protein
VSKVDEIELVLLCAIVALLGRAAADVMIVVEGVGASDVFVGMTEDTVGETVAELEVASEEVTEASVAVALVAGTDCVVSGPPRRPSEPVTGFSRPPTMAGSVELVVVAAWDVVDCVTEVEVRTTETEVLVLVAPFPPITPPRAPPTSPNRPLSAAVEVAAPAPSVTPIPKSCAETVAAFRPRRNAMTSIEKKRRSQAH